MAEFKLVINDKKTGKSYKKTVSGADAQNLIGQKIGSVVKGEILEMPGYELIIKGGSDKQGFPMRHDVEGMGRKKVLLSGGVGFKPKARGQKTRKNVCGKVISENISQINLTIKTYGQKSPDDIFKKEEPAQAQQGEEAKQ